jgi:hypothetical protein
MTRPVLRITLVLCLLAALSACNRGKGDVAKPISQLPLAGTASKTVAIVFGSSENDPWTSALLNTIAIELKIDPLKTSSPHTGFDSFGPYDAQLGEIPLSVQLALCDLGSTADVAAQEKVGELVAAWVNELKPDAVWLDGDQLQLQAGSHIDAAVPIVFSGVTARPDLYYDETRLACGVLRKHKVTRIVDELLAASPATKTIALVSDDSPRGLATIADLRLQKGTLPEGVQFSPQPKVASWTELSQLLTQLNGKADAVLVCAMGADGSAIASKPPPSDIVQKIKAPVVALGPTAIDSLGLTSYRIKPSAQAKEALDLLGQVLGGMPAIALGKVIPEDMEVFRSEAQ